MEPENDNLSAGLSLQEYLAILRRRRAIILQAFVLIAIVGVLVTLLTKPVYQAQGELLVDGPGLNVNNLNAQNPLTPLMVISQPQSADTIVEVLQTPQLQGRVLQQVGQPAQFVFSTVKDTNVIQAQAEAGDPKVAAAAVNEMFQEYIQQDADQSLAGLESSYGFVTQRKIAADKALRVAEARLKAFQEKNNIVEINQNRAEKLGRVTNLRTDLQNQQIGLAVLQARVAADSQTFASQPKTFLYDLPVTNPRVQELKNQIQQLQVQRESLTQAGGLNPHGDSPILKALDAQVFTLRQQLAKQPALFNNKSTTLNGFYDALRSRVADQKASLKPAQTQLAQTQADLVQAEADVARLPDLGQKLDDLTRTRDGAAVAASNFGQEQSDLALREQARRPTAHVIQSALIPTTPVRPKKALNILFACVIGLFVGLCLALLQEFLDDRINTTEDADRLLGLPSLGSVPSLTASDSRLLPQMSGANAASESYRVLRTNVHFAAIDSPLKTLLVASSSPGEGKTTTAVNLAFAMVMDGKKVILLDTDLRRPTVHKMLGLPNAPGLTDVLAGTANLSDVLMQHSQVPGLMALTAGSTPPNPSELLNSRAFKAVLEQLKAQADLVIMDSPPALAAADAQILAAQVDGVVLVVEPGETKKAAAKQTLGMLRHARANVLGIAYNKMRLTDKNGAAYYYTNTPTLRLSDGKKGKAAQALPVAAVADKAVEADTE